jgi:hemerythrin
MNGSNKPRKVLLEHHVFISWDPKYNLGIPIIDEQHRGIVTTINSLHFGIQNNFINSTFAAIVQMMMDYTKIHFEIEEAFLETINYSQAKEHKELHNILLDQLVSTGKQSLSNKDPKQFMDFLKSWWINHICDEDLKYKDYLVASSTVG